MAVGGADGAHTHSGVVDGGHAPPRDEGPDCHYAGDNPAWATKALLLAFTRNDAYGGIVIRGACPRCTHEDGIAIFIPTTWATVGGQPLRAAGARATALARPRGDDRGRGAGDRAAGDRAAGDRAVANGETTMTVSGARALIPFERGPGDPPAMKLRSGRKADKAERTEFVEIVLCRCWADHKAPSGKSGCGFWRYITFNSAG